MFVNSITDLQKYSVAELSNGAARAVEIALAARDLKKFDWAANNYRTLRRAGAPAHPQGDLIVGAQGMQRRAALQKALEEAQKRADAAASNPEPTGDTSDRNVTMPDIFGTVSDADEMRVPAAWEHISPQEGARDLEERLIDTYGVTPQELDALEKAL